MHLMWSWNRIVILTRDFLKLPTLLMLIKQNTITFWKLGSRNFWGIANSVLRKGKSAIPPWFNGAKVFSLAPDKTKLFAETFSKNSYLDDLGVSLSSFPFRTNLKLHKSLVIYKLVKKVITNLVSPVVVLKNCESDLS